MRVLTDDTNYKTIAEEIRLATGETQKYKPSEMWMGVNRVYAAGVTNGEELGKEMGREEGKQAEHKLNWNAMQNDGERKTFRYFFMYGGWDDTTFDPEHDFILAGGNEYMFANSRITNFTDILERKKVKFDTSNATNVQAMFQGCSLLKKAPKIDLSNVTGINAQMLFNSCQQLEEVEEVVFNSGITSTASTFNWCTSLKRLKIIGEIACSLDVGYSPLDAESLVSVVEHFSTTKTGLTLTVKQTAVNNADWSKTNYASWDELKAIRPNLGFAYM